FIQTTPSRPAALRLPHKTTGLPADLTNEKIALLHGSLLTGERLSVGGKDCAACTVPFSRL
ncbi:hypothetical protein L0N24_14785, partial [Faecalibacterium prausnitzii]|uniref:hypothetical protein n=1 Tax=Faecalibacterium prausnitzii TaxID=853 RepID=UPI001EE031F0